MLWKFHRGEEEKRGSDCGFTPPAYDPDQTQACPFEVVPIIIAEGEIRVARMWVQSVGNSR